MKAILVEDNPGAINVLKSYIAEYPSGISICGTASTLETARQLILDQHPDIWLLDIQLQDKLIFSLIRELDPALVERATIIFITAFYDPSYIHQALKISALDFIVKPIDKDQLFQVLDKARIKLAKNDLATRIDKLEDRVRQMDPRQNNQKIPVYRVSGEIDYEDKKEVIYFITEANITRINLADGKNVATNRNLKFYEDTLEGDPSFLRISKQTILNLEYLKSFNPKTDTAILSNGTTIQVSRRKASILLKVLSGDMD